jgi:hypothetical protein
LFKNGKRSKLMSGKISDSWGLSPDWFNTTITPSSKPQQYATSSELIRILDNLERLNQQVYSLSKTVETLTTENEYLKEMMDEEFRRTNE